MLPSQSILALVRTPISRRLRYDQMVPPIPIGTDTRKTSRQSTAASTPPRISPMKDPEVPATWLIPMAVPRWSGGNASVRIAGELAISMEPPTACTTRHKISHSAPLGPVNGSNGSATAARPKMAKPRLYMRTRPYMSPSRPRVTTRTAETSRYPISIQSR